ncbi:MAG: hypothetical protein OIF58_08670 [Cohaesibacter sp.]|nr:hypothetical protein [Cohaesibacter sp.]
MCDFSFTKSGALFGAAILLLFASFHEPAKASSQDQSVDGPIVRVEDEVLPHDLLFAFSFDAMPLLENETGVRDNPDIEHGDILSGADVLDRLNAREAVKDNEALLEDTILFAFLKHPFSGKSFELQLAHCASLNYDTSEGPFSQQVQCDKDLYSYRASATGIDVLINGELHMTLPLDPGPYRLNGIDIHIK